jgi:hypothetical protein
MKTAAAEVCRRSNCSAGGTDNEMQSRFCGIRWARVRARVVDGGPPAVASRSKAQTIAGTIEVGIGDVKISSGHEEDARRLRWRRELKVGA